MSAEALEEYETAMHDVVEDSRLYTLISSRPIVATYDSGFAARMGAISG